MNLYLYMHILQVHFEAQAVCCHYCYIVTCILLICDITVLNPRVQFVCVCFTVLPVPGPVCLVAGQCSAAFSLSPSLLPPSPSQALHSSS